MLSQPILHKQKNALMLTHIGTKMRTVPAFMHKNKHTGPWMKSGGTSGTGIVLIGLPVLHTHTAHPTKQWQ